jgi:hypothetical protein
MESEIDGLAEVVEQIASRENDHQSPPKMPCAPKIVESMAEGEVTDINICILCNFGI